MESLSPLSSVFVPQKAEGNADVPQVPYKTLSFWFGACYMFDGIFYNRGDNHIPFTCILLLIEWKLKAYL